MKKLLPVWALVLIDLLATALCFGAFMMYYYVLPQKQENAGIVITRPASAQSSAADAVSEPPTDDSTPGEAAASSSGDSASRQSGGREKPGSSKSRGRAGRGSLESGAGEVLPSGDALETNTEASAGDFSAKFADKFTSETVITESGYTSPGVSVSVERRELGEGGGKVTYYVADIYVANIESFRTAFAQGSYGRRIHEDFTQMSMENNAIAALSGDYYGNHDSGVVIRNGVLYRSASASADICVLYYDGTIETMPASEFDEQDAITRGAWQAWTFGPALLDDGGAAIANFSSSGYVANTHPRGALGYYEPGHYCFVVVDGRQAGYSSGMTLSALAKLFESLGCSKAYNLDGGDSAMMSFSGELANSPSDGGRELSDILYIAEMGESENA